tara:strand:- start:159 stop:347 length:189 start_codon:yes stop_codon:yes gene_type:complete
VAQLVARWTSNPEVAGSIPAEGDYFFIFYSFLSSVGQSVVLISSITLLSYAKVAGSSPAGSM